MVPALVQEVLQVVSGVAVACGVIMGVSIGASPSVVVTGEAAAGFDRAGIDGVTGADVLVGAVAPGAWAPGVGPIG